jgi:cohesin loading factor subunit SCC2
MGRAPQPTQLSTSRVNDGQAEADAALYKFEELLRNIFNAEDGLQSDSSVVSVVDGNSLIVEINVSESTPFALAAATQIKLQNQIPKLVKLERFGDVALDDLVRLQRLCERPLASAQTVSLKLDSDFSESDVDDWLQKVELAQLGLLSAGTLMRIMMAQREEKELRSEENIIAIPNALNNVFENCVVQVVECRSQGRTSDLFAMF